MNRKEIIKLRLFNQGISVNRFEKPNEVVAHFGAMQAQDYSMALWAIGLRMKNPDRSVIENLINSCDIIRTHILRATWHLVHCKDIRWMMELSAPNIKKAAQYIDKKEGLTNELFLKVWKIIERKFKETDNLSKENMISALSKHKIIVNNLLATQIILRAEIEMLLCNGEKKGTYALFEKRIPKTDKIRKSEAITRLAQLYFSSRGPATIKDFTWWSGLSMSDAKTGIDELGKQLESFTFNDLKYYNFEIENNIPAKPTFAFLPWFDEYTVGYSEGRKIVLPTNLDYSINSSGILNPIILSGNEIVGTWRKCKKSPFVEIHKFSDNKEISATSIKKHTGKFNLFNK